MSSISKYDYLLAGIAITIILMLTGIIVTPAATVTGGVLGIVLTGVAMFVVPPKPHRKV